MVAIAALNALQEAPAIQHANRVKIETLDVEWRGYIRTDILGNPAGHGFGEVNDGEALALAEGVQQTLQIRPGRTRAKENFIASLVVELCPGAAARALVFADMAVKSPHAVHELRDAPGTAQVRPQLEIGGRAEFRVQQV